MRIIFYIICAFALTKTVYAFSGGAYADRSTFFNGGSFASGLFGMIVFEVLYLSFILHFLTNKETKSGHLVILSVFLSLASFSRSPLVMGLSAVIVKKGVSINSIRALMLCLLIMFVFLGIRDTAILTDPEKLYLFFVKYSFVGINRFFAIENLPDLNFIQAISLYFRAFDAIVYPFDFLAGSPVSGTRLYSKTLNEFIELPSLNGSFNAYGTILFRFKEYPILSPLLLLFDLCQIYILSLLAFKSKYSAKRVIYWLLSLSFLYSFNGPFLIYAILVNYLINSVSQKEFRDEKSV